MAMAVQGCTNGAAWAELFGDRHLADHQQHKPTEDGQCPACPDEAGGRPRASGDPPERAEATDNHADGQGGHADESDDPTNPPAEGGSTTYNTTITEVLPAGPPPGGSPDGHEDEDQAPLPGGAFVLGEPVPQVPEAGSFNLP